MKKLSKLDIIANQFEKELLKKDSMVIADYLMSICENIEKKKKNIEIEISISEN